MDQGSLKEMEHPHILLDDRSTLFSKLVDKSPGNVATALRKTAYDHYVSSGEESRRGAQGGAPGTGLLGGMGGDGYGMMKSMLGR